MNIEKLLAICKKYDLIIFDMDGTLIIPIEGSIVPNDNKDFLTIKNVKESLSLIKSEFPDLKLAICTNQGGVSCGYKTEREFWQLLEEVIKRLGVEMDDVSTNFYYPRPHVPTKMSHELYYKDIAKPSPDMVHLLYQKIFKSYLDLDQNEQKEKKVLLVGDGFTDKGCAQNAEIDFIWAHNFFQWPEDKVVENKYGHQVDKQWASNDTLQDILEAKKLHMEQAKEVKNK